MDKRSWYEANAAGEPQKEWLPRIKLGKDGVFAIEDRDGDRDGEKLGEKFSAVLVHKVYQRRLWEGFPDGKLVCGADKAEGMRGMVPHFQNPRAAHCGVCPHNARGDGTCKAGITFVVGRIGKSKSDDLLVLRGSGLTVGAWINLESKLEEGAPPLAMHRLIFQATDHPKAPRPIVGLGRMKEVTDAEFEQFVEPNHEKAVETLKPLVYDLPDASPTSHEEAHGSPEMADHMETGDAAPVTDADYGDEDIPF